MPMETKNIPLKNYIILGIIIVFSVLVVFYVRSWYITAEEYYENNSIILDTVAEINSDEISNYSVDNPSFVLYVASGSNANVKSFEKKFKKFILQNDLNNNVLYLNLANVDINQFNNQLNVLASKSAKSTLTDQNSSAIYIFKEGRIVKVMNSTPDIDKVKIVFQGYGMIEND